VSSVLPPPERASFALRQRLLAAGFFLLVIMSAAAGYLIVRSVNRELAAVTMQADFVAAVSHEFRTPLTTLRQFTDMLGEQRNLTADRLKVIAEAQSRATERLTRLVESLLDFGRMEAGARRYTFQAHDCGPLAKKVVDDYRDESRAEGHPIMFSSAGSSLVEADADALSIAIRNLIDNAAKYSPPHEGIDVAIARQNGDVRISVQDRGPGIPEREQSRIFRKFQRGEQARVHGISGTGLGLAMVSEIVRAHRGRVELVSATGRGSTFTIVLPAKESRWPAS
jgi:signal transduction histidine kinase